MKSHTDNVEIIGTTHATSRSIREKRWNKYYHGIYQSVVENMLADVTERDTVLDVGTSHGHWFPFFKAMNFKTIMGIELDENRAELARESGYDHVHTADASKKIPLASESVDVAISNDVFVHILQMDAKKSALAEIHRVLKPNGLLILNHTMSRAYGYAGYQAPDYCSYLDLSQFIELVTNSLFAIHDIKPTYFNFRNNKPTGIKFLKALITLPVPFGLAINRLFNFYFCKKLPLDASDVVYIKGRKDLLLEDN